MAGKVMKDGLPIQNTILLMTVKRIRKEKPKALQCKVGMTGSMAMVIITEQDLDGHQVVNENTVSAKPHTSNTL